MKQCIFLLVLLICVICFCSGCNLLLKIFQKEAAEEKELFGDLYNYNDRVEELQQILKEVGYNPGSIDGNMGYRTRAAVKVFQKKQSLKTTGYVDKKTWKKLKLLHEEFFSLKQVTVIQIQKALKNAGFNPGALDNKLGPKTKKAIREFQGSQGLTVDGKVGPKIWESLREYLSRQGND